jgi:hypothetical protein
LENITEQSKKIPNFINLRRVTMEAFAGFIRCSFCGGAMVPVRGNEYYGCCNAKRKICKNRLLILKNQIETIVLNDLKKKFLSTTSLTGEKVVKGYYVAHTSFQTVALLSEKSQPLLQFSKKS